MTGQFNSLLRLIVPALLLAGLSGCGDGGVPEVKRWMDQVRSETKVSIPKLPEPKKFTPFAYTGKTTIDPYNPGKLTAAFIKQQVSSGNSLKPDLDRRREPLETFPLDALKMVGTLERAGLSYAILQADKAIYQIKVGNYIGQNLGLVTGISETAVDIREVVQDASGDWVERKAKLELQETKK
jgi:type IV pilus assembly protein PilP